MEGLSVRSNVKEFSRYLTRVQRKQLPFAVAKALTKTAQDVVKREKREMKRVFDRPVARTLNSMFIRPAKKTNLTASVQFKDGPSKGTKARRYLRPHIVGGSRSHTPMERRLKHVFPTIGSVYIAPAVGLKRTGKGKMHRGELVQILSQLKVLDKGNNITAKSRRGKKAFYFVKDNVIYRRMAGERRIVPVLVLIRSPRYRKRFRFNEVAAKHATKRFPARFQRALRDAVKTAF